MGIDPPDQHERPNSMPGIRVAWRVLLLTAVFLVVGFLTAHALIHHAVARGAPEYDVRLAGYMGGLFCGGLAALVAGVILLIGRKNASRGPE